LTTIHQNKKTAQRKGDDEGANKRRFSQRDGGSGPKSSLRAEEEEGDKETKDQHPERGERRQEERRVALNVIVRDGRRRKRGQRRGERIWSRYGRTGTIAQTLSGSRSHTDALSHTFSGLRLTDADRARVSIVILTDL